MLKREIISNRKIKFIIIFVVLFSTVISFLGSNISYAELLVGDKEFYYPGKDNGYIPTTKKSSGSSLLDIVDWIINFVTLAPRLLFATVISLVDRLVVSALKATVLKMAY